VRHGEGEGADDRDEVHIEIALPATSVHGRMVCCGASLCVLSIFFCHAARPRAGVDV